MSTIGRTAASHRAERLAVDIAFARASSPREVVPPPFLVADVGGADAMAAAAEAYMRQRLGDAGFERLLSSAGANMTRWMGGEQPPASADVGVDDP